MAYTATHKHARISARKVRSMANLIRGKHADEALDILNYMPHRGARMLEKVLTWKQSKRYLTATWIGPLPPPFPEEYIRDHAANVHLIPATDNLKLAIASLKDNDLVLLEGLLVDAEGGPVDEIKIFHTSLTRTDLAPGGCELMYVERLVVEGTEYR